jgi:membrane fusion protein (multidrug efflux system)
MIPEQAIVPEQSRQYVFVVGDDDVVSKREVQIGRRRPGQVEVVKGLEVGEVVITEGTQKVKPGSRVRVIRQIEVTP